MRSRPTTYILLLSLCLAHASAEAWEGPSRLPPGPITDLFDAPRLTSQFDVATTQSIVSGAANDTNAIAADDFGGSILTQAENPAITVDGSLAWWNSTVLQPMRPGERGIPVDSRMLMALATHHSQKVGAVREVVQVRLARVSEQCAAFDTALFSNNSYNSISDPVGNTLTTGGPPRLREDGWGVNTGLQRRTVSGASLNVAQQLGVNDSNSIFFVPSNQATSRLTVGATQPLLRGRGRAYNTSLIVTAKFDSSAASAEYFVALQDQLSEVAKAYWTLYIHRAALLQRRRHLERAVELGQHLRERRELDALENQVMRANAAIATRQAELVRAEADIRNVESRVRALTNAPALYEGCQPELVPSESPLLEGRQICLPNAVETALRRRPEIDNLKSSLSAAAVRMQVAEHELLPSLDLVLQGYLAGLQGDNRLGQSWVDQFGNGPPGYNMGLQFGVPLGNRAARARMRQRCHERNRLEHLLRETFETIRAEVEVAVRTFHASYQTAVARRGSLAAVKAELAFLEDRWLLLRGDEALGRLQLEDLLNAQDRLLSEELLYSKALADYQIALIDTLRATGSLVRSD